MILLTIAQLILKFQNLIAEFFPQVANKERDLTMSCGAMKSHLLVLLLQVHCFNMLLGVGCKNKREKRKKDIQQNHAFKNKHHPLYELRRTAQLFSK